MYRFGKKSIENLQTCHHDLQKIMYLAISRSPVDFGISEGHRSISRQQQLFREGKSKIDGIKQKGKHNYDPSLACDTYAYHPDIEIRRKMIYDTPTLSLIAGIVISCARELKEKGEISHDIRWGGNWDMDGVIIMDQSFDDLPHFELHE